MMRVYGERTLEKISSHVDLNSDYLLAEKVFFFFKNNKIKIYNVRIETIFLGSGTRFCLLFVVVPIVMCRVFCLDILYICRDFFMCSLQLIQVRGSMKYICILCIMYACHAAQHADEWLPTTLPDRKMCKIYLFILLTTLCRLEVFTCYLQRWSFLNTLKCFPIKFVCLSLNK